MPTRNVHTNVPQHCRTENSKICFVTTDGHLPHYLETNGIPSSESRVTALAVLACCNPLPLLTVLSQMVNASAQEDIVDNTKQRAGEELLISFQSQLKSGISSH